VTATTTEVTLNAFHEFCLQFTGSALFYDRSSSTVLALRQEETDTEPSQNREGV